LATELDAAEVTQALADELKSSDPGIQVVLIAALTVRGDRTVAQAVARAAGSGDEAVRVEALGALQVLGDASHVKLLAEAAASGGKPGEAAAFSLTRLAADGVDEAIIRQASEVEPKTRVVLVRAMADRRPNGAVPPLMRLAADPDASVRREALRALGLLAGPDHLPDLVKLLTGATEDRDRQEAAEMVLRVAKGLTDRERRRQCLVAAWPEAAPAARAHLIAILGGVGELEIVEVAVSDESNEVQDAAARTLAAWPDAAPMETLRQLAEKASREVLQILALRGYLRMLSLPSQRSPSEDAERYGAVLKNARRPEEKKLILNALGNVADFGVLALIEQQMRDESIQAQAEAAYLKAAKLVVGTRPGEMRAEFQRLAAANGRFGERGREVLDWITKCDGHITTWLVSGPYTHPAGGLFDRTFPPEQPDARNVAWRPVNGADGPYTKFITPGAMNLGALIGGNDCTAYLRTGVYCPEKRKALLQLGSDDSVKVWLNGKLVHANQVTRALKRAEDSVRVELEKGWNILLLKVVQADGEWGACARFANLDGTLMEGLQVRPQ
jgi:HEAT repeat protein